MTLEPIAPEETHAGRPRSAASHEAILDAAFALLVEEGASKVSIEGISRRAGVGKATIYRWWNSKTEVLLEATLSRAECYPSFHHTGDIWFDLLEEIRGVIRFFRSQPGKAFLDLVAESRFDTALAAKLAEQFVAGRRTDTEDVLDRGIASGQIRPDLDKARFMDMVWGSIYYRFLVLHDEVEVHYADSLIDACRSVFSPQESED